MTFKKLIQRLADCRTEDDINAFLYDQNGVDISYQREKITWNDHELLFTLAARINTEG